MTADRPLVTLCMIVRDEAANLPRCLESARALVEQIVVIDTGSTDDTIPIALDAGALVIERPWTDDFAAARNHALPYAAGEWILHLDADEELDPTTAHLLRPWLTTTTADGGQCTVRNLQPPDDPCAWSDTQIVRLFRNRPAHRWTGRIHEQVGDTVLAGGGAIAPAPIRIVHHGYTAATVQGGRSRAERNLALQRRHLEEHLDDPFVRLHFADACNAAQRFEEAEAAYRTALTLDGGRLGPLRRNAHVRLAQLLLARNAHDLALTEAERALALDPDCLPALQVRGVAALSLGRVRPALVSFERALVHPELRDRYRADFEVLVRFCRTGSAA